MNDQGLTLLSDDQIWGESQLEVIRKYGTKAAVTDLCVLTGSYLFNTDYNIDEDRTLTGRTSRFWTRSNDGNTDVCAVDKSGDKYSIDRDERNGAIRPVLQSSAIFSQISPNRVKGYNGTEEVVYGEYPQNVVNERMQNILESEYKRRMNITGRSYTFDCIEPRKNSDCYLGFRPITYYEYEYQGKKYIRVAANFLYDNPCKLSNGVKYGNGDYVWVEVSPVKWLIDDRTGILISKKGLVSGIRFLDGGIDYKGDFDRTEMKKYLDEYMFRDLTQTDLKDMKKQLEELKEAISKQASQAAGTSTNRNIRTVEGIENMRFEGGGDTDFDVAVGTFSKRVENKIIFTDGKALMPDMSLDAIWIVLGGKRINPKGGKVIHINAEKLKKLYNCQMTNKTKKVKVKQKKGQGKTKI